MTESLPDETVTEKILDVKHCAGCRDDFYNDKNPLGVKMCWSRKGAKLVPRVLIHVDSPPPYKGLKVVERPTCYRTERHISVDPDRIGTNGYWKSR